MPAVFYSSDEVGAPTLNNAPGSLANVMRACLVTGFRVQTLDSMSVSGGVARAVKTAHGYSVDRIVEVSDSSIAALNGRKRVLSADSSSFTFAAPGVADTASVGGTIGCRRPPLGWEEQFSAAGDSIFRRTELAATTQVLWVQSSAANLFYSANNTYWFARWNMAESATSATSVTAPAFASGFYAAIGNNATAQPWVVIGDERSVYLVDARQRLFGFGDLVGAKSGDPYRTFLLGREDSTDNNALTASAAWGVAVNQSNLVLARKHTTLGGAVRASLFARFGVEATSNDHPTYPSPYDFGAEIEYPLRVRESDGTAVCVFRGALPGMGVMLIQSNPGMHKRKIADMADASRFYRCLAVLQSTTYLNVAFDESQPWQ